MVSESLACLALEVVAKHVGACGSLICLRAETERLEAEIAAGGGGEQVAKDDMEEADAGSGGRLEVAVMCLLEVQRLEARLEELTTTVKKLCELCWRVDEKTMDLDRLGLDVQRICVRCVLEKGISYCQACETLKCNEYDDTDDDDDDEEGVAEVFGILGGGIYVKGKECWLMCKACRERKYVKFRQSCQKWTNDSVEFVEGGVWEGEYTIHDLCGGCQQKHGVSYCEGCGEYKTNVPWWFHSEEYATLEARRCAVCFKCPTCVWA